MLAASPRLASTWAAVSRMPAATRSWMDDCRTMRMSIRTSHSLTDASRVETLMSHTRGEVMMRRLGATGVEITPVGLGCMQFAGSGLVEGFYRALDQSTVTSVVGAALDGGITWFDTAEMYGRG